MTRGSPSLLLSRKNLAAREDFSTPGGLGGGSPQSDKFCVIAPKVPQVTVHRAVFGPFLAASAGLHLLFLGWQPEIIPGFKTSLPGEVIPILLWQEPEPALVMQEVKPAPMPEVQASTPPVAVKAPSPAKVPPPAKAPAAKPSLARPGPESSKKAVVAEVAPPPRTALSGAPLARESADLALRTLLIGELARHFDYPPKARKKGWEGEVVLAILIAPDGVLSEVLVSRGSGFELLDRSALESAKRIGRIQGAEEWLGGRSVRMDLPVTYRLSDS